MWPSSLRWLCSVLARACFVVGWKRLRDTHASDVRYVATDTDQLVRVAMMW